MGTIEDIYYGTKCHYEEISKTIPAFPEYSDKIIKKSEEIKQTLSEQQMRLFSEYDENLDELHRLLETHSFVEGFKLGAKIIAEIFGEKI